MSADRREAGGPRTLRARLPLLLLGSTCVLAGSCAKTVEGGCASDDDCAEGVRCNRATHRCLVLDGGAGDGSGDGTAPVCLGAVAGQDDPACGAIDCDELDNGCKDYVDLTTGRCAGDGVCKTANDPLTCLNPADRCFPYTCDASGAEPICRTYCDTPSDCAGGGDCPAGRCCQGAWERHTIETAGDVGTWARITTDAAGNAYAAWLDAGAHRVHAGSSTVTNLGAWATETVPPPNAAFWYGGALLSLGVDDAGTRHLLYYDENSGDAVYGADDGSGWTATPITMGAGWSRGTLVVSGAGLVSIVVADGTGRQFQYRGTALGVCGAEATDSLLQAAALDTAGRVHFLDWDGGIRYFSQSTVCDPAAPVLADCCDFDMVPVTLVDPMGGDPQARHSIAVDPVSGDAHATFYRGQDHALVHATCDRSICSTEFIDSTGDVGRYSSIVVGAGALHVAYYAASTEDLRYATNASGMWRTYVIDAAGTVGEYASLARGPDGRLHAAYYDATGKDALYSTLAPDCVPGE